MASVIVMMAENGYVNNCGKRWLRGWDDSGGDDESGGDGHGEGNGMENVVVVVMVKKSSDDGGDGES